MILKIFTAFTLFISFFPLKTYSKTDIFNTTKVPTPIFDSNPGYVELYWKAWEMAYNHVIDDPGAPHSPYMDEVCYDFVIWIWDSCFMTLFNRYASNDYFPGVSNLNNIYMPFYDSVGTTQSVWFADNPNLFAWVEWENFLMTGDVTRVKWLINDRKYLQKHFMMMESSKPGDSVPSASHRIAHERLTFGYTGSNQIVGMDNSPRGRTYGEDNILWIDIISQQALSAYYISKLAEVAGNEEVKNEYNRYYGELKGLINRFYWDEDDGFYYDINKNDPSLKDKVKTVASFWPLLAFVADQKQAKKLFNHFNSNSSFGGFVNFPSVSRDDPDFDNETGAYWRGGLWLPTAYMGIKGIENYGYCKEADEASEKILNDMYVTYKTVIPHTIWETYAPSSNAPSTEYGNIVRQDFCGWSALGPISLFIENVIGFNHVNAIEKVVEWRLHQKGRHGITNFSFGDVKTDIVYCNDTITVRSNGSYTLKVNNVSIQISEGIQSFDLTGKPVQIPEILPFDPTPLPYVAPNIARNKESYAASLSDSAHGPEKANDGDRNTMWIAANGNPNNWWYVDLGDVYNVTKGEISFEKESLWKYRIEGSFDGISWFSIVDRSDNDRTIPVQEFDCNVVAQFIRVVVTESAKDSWTSIRLFQLFGDRVNVVSNQMKASASNYQDEKHPPSAGNDGSVDTMWIAKNGDLGNWWMVDLGEVKKVTGSQIIFEKEGDLWKYVVEGSVDGNKWKVLEDRSDTEKVDQIQCHRFVDEVQFVRVRFTGLPDDNWAAFKEFEVFGD